MNLVALLAAWIFGTRTRHWAASVKNQVLCFEKAELLFERMRV